MKSTEFITEAPLPDDWDTQVFRPGNAIKKQVDYVLANSSKLGVGSSRVVTSIMYQGRPTALKIAKNRKGLAQNEAELEIVTDGYAKGMGIIIPVIDWDKENDPPRWLQFEMANKATEKQLCSLMKCTSLYDLCLLADIMTGATKDPTGREADKIMQRIKDAGYVSQEDEDTFYEYANQLGELANSFSIQVQDFNTHKNWGIYKGKPVVIDIGFTSGVSSAHYS